MIHVWQQPEMCLVENMVRMITLLSVPVVPGDTHGSEGGGGLMMMMMTLVMMTNGDEGKNNDDDDDDVEEEEEDGNV